MAKGKLRGITITDIPADRKVLEEIFDLCGCPLKKSWDMAISLLIERQHNGLVPVLGDDGCMRSYFYSWVGTKTNKRMHYRDFAAKYMRNSYSFGDIYD